MKEQSNFFDDLKGILSDEELKELESKQQAQAEKIDNLIHRVFAQNEHGKELLEIWQEALILNPTVVEGAGLESHGIEEGKKRFIRGILLTIRRVENG